MIHELKTYPKYFEETLKGNKSFECRLDDRGFQVGDIVVLREWDDIKYSGREVSGKIKYILDDSFIGLKKGYAILSLDIKAGEQNG